MTQNEPISALTLVKCLAVMRVSVRRDICYHFKSRKQRHQK